MDLGRRPDNQAQVPSHLLIFEDESPRAVSLWSQLETFGHDVTHVRTGHDALRLAIADAFDAIVLESLPPNFDGLAVLKRLRRLGINAPVILISSHGDLAQKIEGLEAGADDYLVRPIEVAELHARLRAIWRRQSPRRVEAEALRAGDIVVSPSQHRAWRSGVAIDLTHRELDVLVHLARTAGSTVTRATLLERVWGMEMPPTANIVDATILRLRARLAVPGHADPIVTVRGAGYMLRA